MNPHSKTLLAIAAALSAFVLPCAQAAPIDFSEVSLLVRARESQPAIAREVSQRKLLHPLSPQQEQTLRAQGAGDSLLQTLRRSDVVLSKDAAAAYEARREQLRQAGTSSRAANESSSGAGSNVRILNVAFGYPINLSQFGGLDYEIAFYNYRFAGEDHVEPVMIDNIRTVTEVSRPIRFTSEAEAFTDDFFPSNSVRNKRFTPYSARGDLRDARLAAGDTVSVRSNSASRELTIDWQNPIFIKGQPYAFYPVYGAGNASLYYIGKANDRTARVAIIATR